MESVTSLRKFSFITWPLSLTFCILGCSGDDGPRRIPVSGLVYTADIDGPLNGSVAFLPTGVTRGPAANGLIKVGKYSFSEVEGPVAGLHRVLIDVEPPRGKMEAASAQTNKKWKFEFEVNVPDQPPYELDFHLDRSVRETSE